MLQTIDLRNKRTWFHQDGVHASYNSTTFHDKQSLVYIPESI